MVSIIAFYKTPVGQKMLKESPLITTESSQIGQQWAATIVPEFDSALVRALGGSPAEAT